MQWSHKRGRNIIFVPVRGTNNNFAALTDKCLFDNNAEIKRFDKKLSDQNFYDSNENFQIYEEDKVYFLDDEIDTGNTLDYFYTLLRNTKGGKERKFDGIFTLFDRTSFGDADIVRNYLSSNSLDKFYVFCDTEVQPIKTHEYTCFLCKRRCDYRTIFRKCTLDLTRYQFLERMIKLQDVDATDIELSDNTTDIKNFIKYHVVDSMLANNGRCNEDSEEEIRKEIFNSIYRNYKSTVDGIMKNIDERKQDFFRKVFAKSIKFEIKIAYYKAMSFPKIVYHIRARKKITELIISKLVDYSNKAKNGNIKDIAKSIYSYEEKEFISDLKKKHTDTESQNLLNFMGMEHGEIDKLNALISIAGYLEIKYLVSYDMIKLHHELYEGKKKISKIINNSLSKKYTYPFAVKMVTSVSKSAAKELDINIKKFFTEEEKEPDEKKAELELIEDDEYTKVRALYLENTEAVDLLSYRKYIKENKFFNEKNLLEDRINTIIDALKSKNKNISGAHIYINEHFVNENDELRDYMEKSSLVNIKGFEKVPMQLEEKIYDTYYGIIRNKDRGFDRIDYSDQNISRNMPDTWANMYIEDKKMILVRLVSTGKSELEVENRCDYIGGKKYRDNIVKYLNETKAIIPVGVLAIELKEKRDLATVSREFLKLNNAIVGFIYKEFNDGTIQEALGNKKQRHLDKILYQLRDVKEKVKLNNTIGSLRDNKKKINQEIERLTNSLQKVSHTYKDYIGIEEKIDNLIAKKIDCEDILNRIKCFTSGLVYLFKMGSMEPPKKIDDEDIPFQNILSDEEFLHTMRCFLDSSQSLLKNAQDTTFNLSVEGKTNLLIDAAEKEDIEGILFEYVFNASKQNIDYGTYNERKIIDIKFLLSDDAIYIANNGYPIPEARKGEDVHDKGVSMQAKNPTYSSGTGTGLANIQAYLNKVDYESVVVKTNVPIEIDKYTVIFKIQKKVNSDDELE